MSVPRPRLAIAPVATAVLLVVLGFASWPASRVLAQAPPAPLAAALAALDDGYLVDYTADADLRFLGRANHNTGQLMQPGADPAYVSVNNATGYVAVRRGDTIETRRTTATRPIRLTGDMATGIGFRNYFRPEQTPIEVRTLAGPWTRTAAEGAVVSYASPSKVTRLLRGSATAVTTVSVDTITGRITAIRVVEETNGDIGSAVTWTYANWRPAAETADEFALPGPVLEPRPMGPPVDRTAELEGEPAPAILGTTLDGDDVELAPKRTVLFFSATWCGPCKVALRQLNTADFKLRDGYRLVYVNQDDTPEKLSAYFGENFGRLPDEVILQAGAAFDDYNVGGIPTMVEVDETGTVVGHGVGSDPAYVGSLMAGD